MKKQPPAKPSLDQCATTGRVLLDLAALQKKLRVSNRFTVYAWIKRGLLPKPLKFSRRCVRWDEGEIDSALSRLPRGANGTNPAETRAQLKAA